MNAIKVCLVMIERPCKGALFGEGEVEDRREQTAVERSERSDGDQGESYRIKRLRCPRGEAMVKDIGVSPRRDHSIVVWSMCVLVAEVMCCGRACDRGAALRTCV